MRVLISGGGTGGHIFPALAVARALTELDASVEILYVGRRGGMEERLSAEAGLQMEALSIRGIQPDVWRNWRLPYQLPASIMRASALISHFRPDVVFGTGGYVVGAVGLAALLRRKPLYLQVPDAFPGRTVRRLAGRARTVFTAFEGTAKYLPGATVSLSGTPLRHEFWALEPRPRHSLERVLVFGGSQGARRINNACAEALKSLMELPGLFIDHVCGALDFDRLSLFRSTLAPEVQARYRLEQFNPDMISLLQPADLAVARAGGSAIAEMTAVGVPMLLVPGPFAGGHQRLNADPMHRAGAAEIIPDEELSGVRFFEEVRRLYQDPGRLQRMAERSRAAGRPRAAETVAKALLEVA